MKLKRFIAAVSAAVMSGMCMLSNLSAVNAEDYSSYGQGDLAVTQSEEQAFYSQFDESDCSIDLSNITSVPTSCDLSTNEDSKYFPPIGNQGGIGSCTAWATTYYQYTYAANKLNDIETTSSNAYSPTWTYNFINSGGNNGTTYTNAYNVLMHQGALTLSDMPYNSTNYNYSWSTNTSAMMDALKTRLSYSDKVTISATGTAITSKTDIDLKEVKFLISTGHILLTRVKSNSLSNWSTKPRYGNTSESVVYRASSASGGHALAVVGYNDNVCCDVNGNGTIEPSERGAFKIANSWGTSWGNNGYIWVLYDALNKVSANTTNNWESSESGSRISIFARGGSDVDNTFRFIEVENYDVNLAGLLTINTNHRNKLKVDLFRNSNSSTAYTNSISYLNIHKNLDTAASFNGSIVFDYGEYDDPVSICTNGYYFGIDINNLSSTGASAFNNISYEIIDDKFNVVKQISSLPTSIANGNNACKSVRIACQKGDVDYDGQITADDSALLMNYCAMIIDLSKLQYYLGDYNNDGVVNVTDVVTINMSLTATASPNELRKIEAVNQQIKQYMIEKNYSASEIQKVDALNNDIHEKIEVISYEKN